MLGKQLLYLPVPTQLSSKVSDERSTNRSRQILDRASYYLRFEKLIY